MSQHDEENCGHTEEEHAEMNSRQNGFFSEIINGNFSQLENMMGTTAYQNMTETQKVHLEINKTGIAINSARADTYKAISNIINILSLSLFSSMVPVVIWLWKWALGHG